MADQKLLKVTNIATGKVFMKSADEVKAIKGNAVLKGRFTFEKEADTPPLAPKISAPKPAEQAKQADPDAPKQ